MRAKGRIAKGNEADTRTLEAWVTNIKYKIPVSYIQL